MAHHASAVLSGTAFLLLAGAIEGQVTTAQYGNARLNVAGTERVLTPANVRPDRFGRVGSFAVDGPVYAQPLYLPRAGIPGHEAAAVLLVATEHGSVYAFPAAEPGGAPVWRRSFTDAAGFTAVPARDVGCPFLSPEVGITATPVIDQTAGALYVLVRTKEPAAGGPARYVQRLHALDVRNGRDRVPPVEVSARTKGTGAGSANGYVSFDPLRENPRAALLLTGGVVYAAWGSSCDVGPYHGWVMAYDGRSLRQLGALNVTPNGSAAGIWQGDAGLAADSAGSIFAVTGNGTFDATGPVGEYGNSVLRIVLGQGGLEVRDFFTPSNQAELNAQDADLGSSGPILLPDEPGPHPRLLFVAGKSGRGYLLDRDALGHYRPGEDPHAVQTIETSNGGFGAAAFWNHTLYLWGSEGALSAYPVRDGQIGGPPVTAPDSSTDPGAPPVISADGARNGIVWAIETRTWRGEERAAVLHAYDASDVRRELYTSEVNAARDRAGLAVRFAIPTVAGGRVFLGGRDRVDVYGLLGR